MRNNKLEARNRESAHLFHGRVIFLVKNMSKNQEEKGIIVDKKDAGKRLDVFLSEKLQEVSRAQWKKRIENDEVLVGEESKPVHYFLKQGDIIKHKIQNTKFKTVVQDLKFGEPKIIFAADDYLIVNKPAGMVAHRDSKYQGGTLADWLTARYPEIKRVGDNKDRPGIVHRLDKEVSGIMVVARTAEMFEWLKKQFQKRNVLKEYEALVHGRMKQEEGKVESLIRRDDKKSFFVAVKDGQAAGKRAITTYEIIGRWINYTLVKVRILTGRTHQIRVHLRSIGHAITGDKLYATRNIKKRKKAVKIGRIWLYAQRIGFRDLTGEWKEFIIRRPKELEKFLREIK